MMSRLFLRLLKVFFSIISVIIKLSYIVQNSLDYLKIFWQSVTRLIVELLAVVLFTTLLHNLALGRSDAFLLCLLNRCGVRCLQNSTANTSLFRPGKRWYTHLSIFLLQFLTFCFFSLISGRQSVKLTWTINVCRCYYYLLVGGVAQLLERRSMTGELSLSFAVTCSWRVTSSG